MSSAVCYMIEATVDAGEGPCVMQLPVRRPAKPEKREARRILRALYPEASITGIDISRSAQAHLAWAMSGIARIKPD